MILPSRVLLSSHPIAMSSVMISGISYCENKNNFSYIIARDNSSFLSVVSVFLVFFNFCRSVDAFSPSGV